MKRSNLIKLSRRDLITRIMPACAATCLLPCKSLGMIEPEEDELFQQAKHKFDTEMQRKLTYRQMFQQQYFNTINFGRYLKQELGDKEAIELIKKVTYRALTDVGKRQAQQMGNNSFQAYVRQFKDPNGYKYTLTKEVVEDTETVCELKVTECLWASTFLQQNAGDIGFAVVCHGDYAWPQGFNPKIKMVRDKTLMEGHEYCNHRYIWTG